MQTHRVNRETRRPKHGGGCVWGRGCGRRSVRVIIQRSEERKSTDRFVRSISKEVELVLFVLFLLLFWPVLVHFFYISNGLERE
ncbi:hypothetical protein M5D96_012209 [Drosophila gunungcola]|uniref:Transmembrane protein n=1 Tax=Drosophila gunungcola TaxID=103775 RepID=A0A9Q0BK90_9MUSC|nr:hypothetical protein M5D96_012209 [Drosophila gunungcola]